jgi:hypothetical protein
MRREHGNHADSVCTTAINAATNLDDDDLFMDPPLLPPLPRIQHPVTPTAPLSTPPTHFDIPQNINQYAEIRKYKTRNKAPDQVAHLWTSTVKHYLQLFINSNGKEKEDHFVRCMLLPHLFLPKSGSTQRIIRHLTEGSPFSVSTQGSRRTRMETNRLAEAITRHVGDHKLRSANQLLQACADHLASWDGPP